MAHPLFYPGKYYFYPIGNTPAVSFARDLAPEESANILSLGCGDPRNVLHTIFCEHPGINRRLDFTCCDYDPAVLARNVLLLTMIADNRPCRTTIWNIFFHMRLDIDSHRVLVEQCNKLLSLSKTLERWSSSPYGKFLRFCTVYTLAELRRHWSLYAGMHQLPSERMEAILDAFAKVASSTEPEPEGPTVSLNITSARSAGPLIQKASKHSWKQYYNYWKTGDGHSGPMKGKTNKTKPLKTPQQTQNVLCAKGR